MNRYVLGLREIDRTDVAIAGGKGANLGELTRITNIHVSDGFCVTTSAFRKITENNVEFNSLLNELAQCKANERQTVSAKIRETIENTPIADDIANEIELQFKKLDEGTAVAIRSSATAEDLPTASFAGQQDTYLNIRGTASILQHISKCWASLFTDRAVAYRLHNGFDQRKVALAVIVQQMVEAKASGVMFTADPVTSNRKVISIEAVPGLGEGLVSGMVNPGRVLTPQQIAQLERTGRKIEAHFGCPQDIEWCLADDTFYIVQSRPITTLFPIPDAQDNEKHVYVSVSHQQMMTDAIRPLGISIWQLTAARPMYTAGGRLFVDIAANLATPGGRAALLNGLGKSDPLIKDALLTLMARAGADPTVPDEESESIPEDIDPAIAAGLINRSQESIEVLRRNIETESGTELFDFILEDIAELKKLLFVPQNLQVIMAAMNATFWINRHIKEWLGELNVADTLAQSVPNNITAEMGLALMDVADVIRPYPEVIDYLQQVKEESLWDDLERLAGGRETKDAIRAFLDKYGMRCAGEIDITRTRWSEKPTTLLPLILGNIKNFEPNAGKRKFEQGRQEALKKAQDLADRLAKLPDGPAKVKETQRMIGVIRGLSGYREYPKYAIVSRYFCYKQALLSEAERLMKAKVLQHKEDIYYLTIQELREVVRTHTLDHTIIRERKAGYERNKRLTPPRVMTSDGEIITGRYKREDLPSGAMAGLAVSSGVAEGRARVILNIEDAQLEADDILVTVFTDPSWTPLFVSIKGLVTEVGGLMTHGAVIAREYGLPAVVGVENATRLIKDGQWIRVNGTGGYVEVKDR